MTTFEKLNKLFKNPKYLELALTHKSWLNEHPNTKESNERIEFLGDAVLELVSSDTLYKKFADKSEGYLTALRANLVNTVNLAALARKLNLGEAIHLSKGEEESGGRENQSILANTVESIIGAIYLDSGLEKARDFIESNLLKDIEDKIRAPLKDPKSRLQEEVQSKGISTPRYEVIEESGPDHNKKFTVQVFVNGKPAARGTGKSKNEAEQEAAKNALEKSIDSL